MSSVRLENMSILVLGQLECRLSMRVGREGPGSEELMMARLRV